MIFADLLKDLTSHKIFFFNKGKSKIRALWILHLRGIIEIKNNIDAIIINNSSFTMILNQLIIVGLHVNSFK